jgi:hypothetical protein
VALMCSYVPPDPAKLRKGADVLNFASRVAILFAVPVAVKLSPEESL